ncbi:MAG: hypothetical protein GF418_16210 [Chitinivibrionales bacterium]|nr:hypothetical protein [Chitinivibrionales bacterium]MBD3397165.1 hypothetical protein [Chitinivibrionales bacterium]
MALTSEEISRKVLHIFSGAIIPAGILYLPVAARAGRLPSGIAPSAYPVIVLAAVLAIFLVVEFVRLRVGSMQKVFTACFGTMLRREESGTMTGATYIVMSSLICSVLFLHRPAIAFMSLSTFIWGDAVAAVVGLSVGRIRIGSKSLEGSLACFTMCLIMYVALFPRVPLLLDSWGGTLPVAMSLCASLCTTLLELVPVRLARRFDINDNLTVPVATGLLILLLDSLF